MIERLQYITQDYDQGSHSLLCLEACQAGVKWVQLRMKNVSDDEYLKVARLCRKITSDHEAILIINDRLDIALEVGADGVHLGQTDMSTAEARGKVPEGFIIGGTANTLEQIIEHHENGVDYVGVGPNRFTSTKDNLSPILGLEGYQTLINQLEERNIPIPVIAIGGILEEDIAPLRENGVYGVAIAGLITTSIEKKELIEALQKQLNYATA